MRSLQKKEDLNLLVRDYLANWKHLPYRSFFSNDLDAARSYLSQFKEIELGAYKPDGKLFLYTDKHILLGVRHLASESNNFGMHCARLEPAVFNNKEQYDRMDVLRAAEFLRSIIDQLEGPVHLSANAACDDIFCQQVLQLCGFRLADTIAGYHAHLAVLPPLEVDQAVRTARPEDVPKLAEIAANCFSQLRLNINRFNTELAFDKSSVGKTYAEWFSRAVLENDADLVLVYDDGQLSGFLTCRLPPKHESILGMSLGRAILSAVDPIRHGQGIYKRMLFSGARWLQQMEVKLIEGKIHLSNHASIHAWRHLKPRLAVSYNTFHWSSSSIAGLNSVEAILAERNCAGTS